MTHRIREPRLAPPIAEYDVRSLETLTITSSNQSALSSLRSRLVHDESELAH